MGTFQRAIYFMGISCLILQTFAWAGSNSEVYPTHGAFELTIQQWKDFKKRPQLLSGESVMWRVKVISASYREDDEGHDLLVCALMPFDDLKKNNEKQFPVLVVCDKLTKQRSPGQSIPNDKVEKNGNFTYTEQVITPITAKPKDVLVVNGRLMGIRSDTGFIYFAAETILDLSTK